MPITSTFGGGAARGFGLGARARSLVTVVLPAGSSSWVCPAGVTSATISGKGADGSGNWQAASTSFIAWVDVGSAASPPYAQWAAIKTAADNYLATLNSGGSGERTVSLRSFEYWYVNADNTWVKVNSQAPSYKIRNAAAKVNINYPAATGNITYAALESQGGHSGYELSGFDRYDVTGVGVNSTGLGKTFPGGSGVPATVTTFTDVAVTPGTSYPIANNGSLTIQYYA